MQFHLRRIQGLKQPRPSPRGGAVGDPAFTGLNRRCEHPVVAVFLLSPGRLPEYYSSDPRKRARGNLLPTEIYILPE